MCTSYCLLKSLFTKASKDYSHQPFIFMVVRSIGHLLGLWMCIPFAWANEHVKPLSSMEVDWIGKVDPEYYWFYLDYGLLLIFGGIPWQVSLFFIVRIRLSKTCDVTV